ncbi:MAG: hypothetical protein PHD53_02425, partial [Methylococcales bacterium]|nr:hypothetical protein [Methylococcales bacterium]
MSKFDIFIKGINPERLDEVDSIRINVAKALQISVSKVDELLAQPSVCIRRDANEEEAKNYQRTLSKLGLVSLYSPIRRKTNLELIPMAEEIAETVSVCPNCQHEMPIGEDDVAPEKCVECGITIANFLELQRQNKEREAIRAKFLASQTIIQNQTLKKQQEEAEKQRKLELEKEVLEELHGDGAIKKPLNIKLLSMGGGLCVVIASASYFLTQSNSTPPISTVSTPSLATGSEAKPSADSTVQLAIPKGNASKVAAPMDAQQAMQKTHDQAAQFLKGFGLNPDAFANTGGSIGGGEAIPPTIEEMLPNAATPVSNNTAANPATTSAAAIETPTESITPKVTTPSSITLPPLNSQEIFTALNNDITW